MNRTVALGLVLLVSACGSATKSQDAGPVGPSDAPPDYQAPSLPAAVDADPCLYPESCESVTHPGMCKADIWAVSLDLGVDAGACEERPNVPCSFDGGSATFPLDAILGGCPNPGTETTVVIIFSQGCATHLYANEASHYAIDCYLPILSTSRFDCIGQIPCLAYASSTLVPVTP